MLKLLYLGFVMFWVLWYVEVNDSGYLECGSMSKFSLVRVQIILPLSAKHVILSVAR